MSGNAVWLNFHDANIEGAYQLPDGSYVGWSNFATSQPNGGEDENCVVMQADGSWADKDCEETAYPSCEVEIGKYTNDRDPYNF